MFFVDSPPNTRIAALCAVKLIHKISTNWSVLIADCPTLAGGANFRTFTLRRHQDSSLGRTLENINYAPRQHQAAAAQF